MKVVLVIVLIVAAFAGGLFLSPQLLSKAEEKTGIHVGREYDDYTQAAEVVVDLASALRDGRHGAAYKLMGPSYRARVTEAKYVAAWEDWQKKNERITGLGPVFRFDRTSPAAREVTFSLVGGADEKLKLDMTGTLEREGGKMRFETCSMPEVE